MTIVKKVGLWGFIKAAFNARPIGMFVPPNWVGIVAVALVGLLNPGFWAIGAGLELAYLYIVSTNKRFQRFIDAKHMLGEQQLWQQKLGAMLTDLSADAQKQYQQLAGQLMERLSAEEQEIYQVRNQSNQDPLNYPIKLNNKIAALSNVASGDYRPTRQTYAVFDTLTKQLQTRLTAVKTSLDELLPKINALLKAAGLEAIVPGTAELKKESKPVVTT